MRKRITYKVTCPCGGAVVLEVRGFGQELPCATCEGKIVVAWGRDAKNTTTIPVVVRHVPAPGKPALQVFKPAHRPVLKTQVLPQARFFDCVCGERNVLVGTGPGKSVDCSGCHRIHVLQAAGEPAEAPPRSTDVPAAAPPTPKAAPPPPPPPPPPRPVRKPGLGEILCKCGEILPPRTSRTGREFACPACGRKGHVVTAPAGGGIEAVFTYEPSAAACPCGAELPVSEELAGEIISCEGCSRALEVVAKDGRIRLRERA